jgi:predicted DsbA family dithiol-disulfide isomerase
MAASAIPVDVWADVVCPWCYIGHHRLRRALADEPAGSVEVPPAGVRAAARPAAGGHGDRGLLPAQVRLAEALRDELRARHRRGARSGLELRFDRITRAPNTRLAHRLVAIAARMAARRGARGAVPRPLPEGADVADLAQAAGSSPALSRARRAALLPRDRSGEGDREVAAEEGLAARMGSPACRSSWRAARSRCPARTTPRRSPAHRRRAPARRAAEADAPA